MADRCSCGSYDCPIMKQLGYSVWPVSERQSVTDSDSSPPRDGDREQPKTVVFGRQLQDEA